MTHLADDVARLDVPDGLQELLHGRLVLALCVEVVAVLFAYIRDARVVEPLSAREAEREQVLRLAVQQRELVCCWLFFQPQELFEYTRVVSVPVQQKHIAADLAIVGEEVDLSARGEDVADAGGVGPRERDELVLEVEHDDLGNVLLLLLLRALGDEVAHGRGLRGCGRREGRRDDDEVVPVGVHGRFVPCAAPSRQRAAKA